MKKLRIAAFGFRSIPPRAGSAGADKFAYELYPRLVSRGHSVVAYNRDYENEAIGTTEFKGVKIISLSTVRRSGFDTLLHSLKATIHIIIHNIADVIHIQNGGNSIWGVILRLAGKKVYVSQDGVDWKRAKWPWYAKLYLYTSSYITAYVPNRVIFDNIYSRELFEQKFNKKFDFIPFGSEVPDLSAKCDILERLGLISDDYLLFVGRFIPDKGLHYLISAFEQIDTKLKLVLVGGSPNPSGYEQSIRKTTDPRILFPGYIYGDDTNTLIKNAYAYIQPSDVEGLSPVILTAMGLGTPIICSDIPENIYAVGETALTFSKGNIDSLINAISLAIEKPDMLSIMACASRERAMELFNWDTITDQHIELFS